MKNERTKETILFYKEAIRNKEVYERQDTSLLLGNIAKLGHAFTDESVLKFPIEENPFPFVFIDTTLRCNYSCNQCYNPVMPRPDMDVDSFKEVINRLPNPIEIRLLGGEPTLHKDFFEIINIIYDAGHSCYLSTNGYKIGEDIGFARELKEHSKKGKMRIHMDFSCGLSN
jgi:sulfatase maturation enzyme AslB (radical SAM superfamily)